MSFAPKSEMKLTHLGPKNLDIDAPTRTKKSLDSEGKPSDAVYKEPTEDAKEGEEKLPVDEDFDDEHIKNAYETIKRADEIKKNPHLMKHVVKHAKSHIDAISSIDELKAARVKFQDKMMKEKEEE